MPIDEISDTFRNYLDDVDAYLDAVDEYLDAAIECLELAKKDPTNWKQNETFHSQLILGASEEGI